jgi:Tol biopolymer transport system component
MKSLIGTIVLSWSFAVLGGADPGLRAQEFEQPTTMAPVPSAAARGGPTTAVELTAALGSQAEVSTQPTVQSDSIVFRRILKLYDFMFYGRPPSPDGRYVSDVDWRTGDLAVFDLESSGSSFWEGLRTVTDRGSWAEYRWAESSVFSPDGERIAYAWYGDDTGVQGYGLRIIDTDGSSMRVLVPAAEDHSYVAVFDWSADGDHVLMALSDPNETRLSSVSVRDGSIRVLRRLSASGAGSIGRAFFSPDSRYVAYDYVANAVTFDRDIRVLAVDGSQEADVVAGNGNDRVMGWSLNGRGILFHSNRELRRAVWLQPIEQGGQVGEPELIKSDVWQLQPFGFAGDRYFYGVVTAWPHVETAVLDVPGGRVVSPPAPIEDPAEGGSRFGAWSPDGRQFAFLKTDNSSANATSGTLAIRTLETGETRLIPFPLSNVRRLWWGPDGRTMTVFGSHRGRGGIHRMDLQSGDIITVHELDQRAPWDIVNGGFAPDGLTLYAVDSGFGDPLARPADSEEPLTLVAHDLTRGERRTLATLSAYAARVAVSPDGATLAVYEQDTKMHGPGRIRLLPLTGGEGRVVYSFPDDGLPDGPRGFFGPGNALAWTPDGSHILFGGFEGGSESALYALSLERGAASLLMKTTVRDGLNFRGFSLHPDGGRITLWGGNSTGEIWVIEGLPGDGS